MYFIRKLKPGQPGIDLIALFFILPVIFLVFYIWGLRAGWGVLAALECLVCLLQLNMYARTKNRWFLWLASSALVIAFFAIQVALFGLDKNDRHFVPLAAVVVVAIVIMGYIAFAKKTKHGYLSAIKVMSMYTYLMTITYFTKTPIRLINCVPLLATCSSSFSNGTGKVREPGSLTN